MTTMRFIIIFFLFSILILGCRDSNYITVKVRKSAFIPDSYELNRDSLITNGIIICKKGQRYYHKPKFKGGGGNSFEGFTIPPYLDTTAYGYYTMSVNKNSIKVVGIGKNLGYDNYRPMRVELICGKSRIVSTVINN